ncbi:CDP-alcohol phosphatidyltransferase family protein [Paremcibacter congregatus]|uniref:CDP-alcohol phosphatidyltransferase family protein n=1 Tax=Paremcibacter congregatus TaxID=2043170 RepID=UPI003A92D5F8
MATTRIMAIIEKTEFSACKVAGLPLTDRLVKGFIAAGMTEIYVIGEIKGDREVVANEKAVTIHDVRNQEDIPHEGRTVFHIRDNIVLRDSLLSQVATDQGTGAFRSPEGKLLFTIGRLPERETLPDVVLTHDDFTLCSTLQDVREADRRLFSWLYKSTDGIVTVKIDRPLSRIFSRYFARFDMTPAFYTYVNGVQSLLMLWFFLHGGDNALFLGCMMYQVVAVFDCVDGEIARAKFQQSTAGARLDTGIDMLSNILFMGGLSYALWDIHGDSYVALGSYLLLLALFGIMMMITLLYFGPKGGSFDVLSLVIREKLLASERLTSVFTAVNYIMKRDFFALVFAILGMTGHALLIPYSLLGGLIVWNLAILLNARSILDYRYN